MKKAFVIWLFASVLFAVCVGFTGSVGLVGYPTRYVFNIPSFTPAPYEPADNLTTVEGVELGKKLFFDTDFSKNKTVSCSSCHNPNISFSDTTAYSKGWNGVYTERNSMPLINLAWKQKYFWDGRVNSLEELVLIPIQHKDEMGMDLVELENRVKANPAYPAMFTKAFGAEGVSKNTIAKALAQYLRSITSFENGLDTLYGYYVKQGQNVDGDHAKRLGYTPKVIAALALCERCHSTITYGGIKVTNNGLEADYKDKGLAKTTGKTSDNGMFMAPTLRNVAITPPYMHDGRFKNLSQVIDHYNSGIVMNPNLDTLLIKNGQPLRLGLDSTEKKQLLEFLTKYMTDKQFVVAN